MSKLLNNTARMLADPSRFPHDVRFERVGLVRDYVADAGMNLVPGITIDDIRADLEGGDGNELAGKFRAPHSSSALAINTFARFRKAGVKAVLGRHGTARVIGFEQKRHHGLSSDPAPNLHMIAEGAEIIAVESKMTEFLASKAAKFSPMYANEMPDDRRGAYYRHMLELVAEPTVYRRLDAAQLIKHAFGLAHCHQDQPATLLYLYWEPENAGDHAVFAEHRREIAMFADKVADDRVKFAAMSYPELWRTWDDLAGPDWLKEHLANLRKRYAVTIPV